ncbi:uncharacterized protein LOC143912688 [Arctopsyche grandis]|uniref:uncharacterized protein LOC143912688 n=1 Tax=Arctopsyche grandis TaxID=121162 RepID=UPI00406D6AEB
MECRLCLGSAPADTSVSIFGDSHPERLEQRIRTCCQIQVKRGDGLPDTVCLSCKTNLELLIGFRKACFRSNEKAQLRLDDCSKIKTEEILLEDVIRDDEPSLPTIHQKNYVSCSVSGALDLQTSLTNVVTATENDNEEIPSDVPIRSRKRKRDPVNWKKNIRKQKRNSGMEYVSSKGVTVPGKTLSAFTHKCRYQCDSFTEDERKLLHSEFWKLGNWQAQTNFIRYAVQIKRPKRSIGKKKKSTEIYMNSKRVCKDFFLKTLTISNRRFTYAASSQTPLDGTFISDNRGKHAPGNKITEDKLLEVRAHINSFPMYKRHYSHKSAPHRKYLSPELSVSKMYSLYKDKITSDGGQTVKEPIYRRELIKQQKDDHLSEVERTHSAKKLDSENENVYITFDCEKTSSTPFLQTNLIYYKRQFWTYDCKTGDAYMYMWGENTASREASYLLKYITSVLPNDCKDLIAYSDSCGGQNRNQTISRLWMYRRKIKNSWMKIVFERNFVCTKLQQEDFVTTDPIAKSLEYDENQATTSAADIRPRRQTDAPVVDTDEENYEKAYDNVRHNKLIEILSQIGLDKRDIRLIGNLYWNQTAVLRVDRDTTESVRREFGKDVCYLYSENIIAEALEEIDSGIKINGTVINNIRYADDTVLLTTNFNDLQATLDAVVVHSSRAGLKLNTKNTKWMIFSKSAHNMVSSHLQINNSVVERVDGFRYLGFYLGETCESGKEIRVRVEQARATFLKLKKVLTTRDLSITLRLRLLRCYVFSILLYGTEAWTLTDATCQRSRSRRKTSWLKNLRQWYGLSTRALFRAAIDKVRMGHLVADVLGGHDPFMVSGHSYLENDSDFSHIEKKKKKININFVCTKLRQEDFVSTDPTAKVIINRKLYTAKKKVNCLKVRWMRFIKRQPKNTFFKESWDTYIQFRNINMDAKRGNIPESLPQLRDTQINMKQENIKDLMTLLDYIPVIHHNFYKSLKYDENQATTSAADIRPRGRPRRQTDAPVVDTDEESILDYIYT